MMNFDDIFAGAALLLFSLIGVAVGVPLVDEGVIFSPEEMVTRGYLEEGWDAVGLGEIATVTGIEPAGEKYMAEGQMFQDCVISFAIIPYSGLVGTDDEGLPLLLLNGQLVYASVIKYSVHKDGCAFYN